MTNDIFVKLLKSKKFKLSKPYRLDDTVLVRVNIDNLKEFSKLKLSRVKMLDKINIEAIKEINTKNAILVSSSSILISLVKGLWH